MGRGAGLLLDLTMCLPNRTAVYEMGHALWALSPPGSQVRYWRWRADRPIDLMARPLASHLGKAAARLVMRDSTHGWLGPWPRGGGGPVLFLDPLFARRTPLAPEDIVLCHDVGPITHAELYSRGVGSDYDAAYRAIQAAAPGLVFVSDYTRRLYLQRYPAAYRFTRVIPPYFREALAGSAGGQAVRGGRYILMVGGLERRKNHLAAIDAFELSGLAGDGYRLVITGPRGNMAEPVIARAARAQGVEHLGFVGDAALASLYRGAEALFFPSLLEGFGVPAVEAPACGLLPIVSRGTVLEEVVGEGGLLVDPSDVDDMAQGLRAAAAMAAPERERRLADILAHQARYSRQAFQAEWAALLERDRFKGMPVEAPVAL